MTSKLFYPAHIMDDDYEHRRLTINALKPADNPVAKILEDGINLIGTAAASAQDAAISAIDSLTGLKINRESNYRSFDFDTIDTIVLPLPNLFADNQNHDWSMEKGTVATLGDALLKGELLGVSASKAIGEAASLAGIRRPIIDPGYFQNYSGSEPREFNTVFDLVPRSAEEAKMILTIIMKLKQYSSPSSFTGGVSVRAPFFFNIQISNEYLSATISLDRVVLKSLNIDYGSDGGMQTTKDGIPKQMTMAITWAEVDMQTAESYSEINWRDG